MLCLIYNENIFVFNIPCILVIELCQSILMTHFYISECVAEESPDVESF
jgi:hypothetical protein